MSQAIFPERLAAAYVKHAGEKYRPSNGTEGECFFASWCHLCRHDKPMREGVDLDECDENECCSLIARSFAFSVTDAEYPTEWQYGKDGQPCCTAFVPAGDAIPTPRCPNTLELF